MAMHCPHCGAKVHETFEFCDECGKPLQETPILKEKTWVTTQYGLVARPTTGVEEPPSPEATVRRLPSESVGDPRQASPGTVISHWSILIEGLQASPLEFYASVEDAVVRRQVRDVWLSRVDWREGGIFSARREYLRIRRQGLMFDICGAPFGTGFFVSWWLADVRPSFKGLAALGSIILTGSAFASYLYEAGVFTVGINELPLVLSTDKQLLLLISALVALVVLYWFLNLILNQVGKHFGYSLSEIPVVGPLFEGLFKPITYYRLDTAAMFRAAVHAAVQEVIDEMTKAKGLRALSDLERKPVLREFYTR